MKPIHLTRHARVRAAMRGATEGEVRETVLRGNREPARRGKWQARWRFALRGGPEREEGCTAKTVEVVFADEAEALVVVTVKVYYAREGA